jgi:uracil-DNA glycosylase
MSSGRWPPSVKVRIVIADVVEALFKADIGETFNFYRDGPDANLRRRRLRQYLDSRADAPFLLVGEAPGYRGARVSGITFTTATIVHRVLDELGLEQRVLLWNVVPTHPGTETSNRRPSRAEIEAGLSYARQLARGRRVIAVGRLAEFALGGPYVRHPSHGGAVPFRRQLKTALCC